MSMESKTKNNYIMSDDMALGFFDADGAVLLDVDKKKNTFLSNSLSFKVVYFLGQSLSKKDAVAKFAEKFSAKIVVDESDAEFRINQSSSEGRVVRAFFQKNEPINLYRLRDFYISEEMFPLLNKKPKSREELLTLARLVSNKSYLAEKNESDAYFSTLCTHIGATAAEIKQGSQIADEMLSKIEAKLQAKQQTQTTNKLSNDYVLGAHFGDGSFYIALTWKPPKTNLVGRLRCEPEWSISGNSADYCQAFATTFGGVIKSVDSRGQCKFVVSGLSKCLDIIPLFENAPWMPCYKQEQFNRWKEALRLLEAQEHYSEEGIIKLLDLTYGLAEKGSRKYTKEQYLAWGLNWLNNPNRQKRAPRGRKPTEPNQ